MSDEKTEEPTQKKFQDSREKGQVAQSQDFNKLLIVAGVFQIMLNMTDYAINLLSSHLNATLLHIHLPFNMALKETYQQGIGIGLNLTLLAIIPAVLIRLIATWSQFGLLIAPKALIPDLNKVNPINSAKQLFSKQKFSDLLLNIVKAIIITTVAILVLKPMLPLLLLIVQTDLQQLINITNQLLIDIQQQSLFLLLVVAGGDFMLKKHFHKEQLKMSKEEVKQEYKQAQGDPHVKGQRHVLAMQIANEAPKKLKSNKKPDAVVVNPTHYAVALYYRPQETPLPQILYHGQDNQALTIIQQAHNQHIPVIRYVSLARRLATLESGSYIPKDCIESVAAVYRILQQLDQVITGEIMEMSE